MMWLLLGSFNALMLLGVPVALALAGSSLLYIGATGTVPDLVLVLVLVLRMIAGVGLMLLTLAAAVARTRHRRMRRA